MDDPPVGQVRKIKLRQAQHVYQPGTNRKLTIVSMGAGVSVFVAPVRHSVY